MATQKTLAPTNQTITIAGFQGEKPDQRQIADAEGKLADAVNALNSQITAATIGTNYTSQSSLESDLTTFGNAMANQDVRNIYFTVGTGGAGVLAQQGYIGRMQRLSTGRYNIMVQSFGDPGVVIIANYRNSAWSWGSATITTLS